MEKIKIGDKAPAFTGITQNGHKVSLSDYNGKKLILYFYPKDNTPGCSAEACSLRDGYSDLRKMGFELLGVSPDGESSHNKFIDKYSLPFDLIADTNKEIAQSYGVWELKKFMGREYMGIVRTTFVINDGIIEKIFDKVSTKDHANQIIESYK